jgi:pSer/pThr/pTyr-binding forkhead associated (FHA) protein
MAMLLEIGDDGAVVRTHGMRQRVTTLGRGLANYVPLPDDPAVSSFHASVQRTPNGYEIQDQSSVNGTWVNGAKVTRRLLDDGDEIRVGSTVLQFVLHRSG